MRRAVCAGAIACLLFAHCIRSDASQSAAPQSAASQSSASTSAGAITIPAGQKFIIELDTAIHTNSTRTGDKIEFRTAADVFAENRRAIPSQSWVRATVTKAKRAGRLHGRAEVRLRIDEVRLADGTALPLRATITRVGVDPVDNTKDGQPRLKGESGTGGSIGTVLQGGMQGAVIGLISAGARGAMYGGAVGAGITLAGMILKRGPDLDLPRETMFEARFEKPLIVPLAVAMRAEQLAQNPPAGTQTRGAADDEPVLKTRPVLRRSTPAEQPPAETAAHPQAPVEDAGNPQPPVDIPRNPQLPAETDTPSVPSDAPPRVTPSGPPASAPAEPVPDTSGAYKLSVNVRMVLVDAVVRDRAGRLMDNLTRSDFRVYEDGVEQRVQSFSRDELPLAVALVIDRSGSVAPYIDELRRIAYHALQQLKPGDRVALFSFANNVQRVEDLTTDRRRIADAVGRIHAGGSTDIIDALYDATTYLAKVAPDSRRAIILVSDNQPTVRPDVSEGETIRTAMESETVIYSLKTSGEGSPLAIRLPSLLMGNGSVKKVAEESGGEVIDVAGTRMLDTALGGVVSRLRLRYSLGYYPPDQGRGGAFHSLDVRLIERLGKPGSDYFIHARRGYYSTGDQIVSRKAR